MPPMYELPDTAEPAPSAPARIEGGFRDPVSGEVASRVVGGKPASHEAWPSLVFVLYVIDAAAGRGSTCGGTVIAPEWVLTAAHCAAGKDASNFRIVEGTSDLNAKGHVIGVDKVIVHEDYTDAPAPHADVALLHLTERAKSPAQLLVSEAASRALLRSGVAVTVAGFGLTSAQPIHGDHTGSGSTRLRQVELPYVERATCSNILTKVYDSRIARVIDAATVCAGDPSGGKDSCNGDSGGPLTIDAGPGRKTQIGVVSWGPGCAQRNTVGVYASVGHFESWIKQRAAGATFYERPSAPPPGPIDQPTSSPTSASIAAVEAAAAAVGGRADIQVDLVEGNRPRVGSLIHFRVVSPIAGQLLVYNVDLVSGQAYQVFPNQYSNGGRPGATKLQIASGTRVSVPGDGDRFDIRVKEPAGRNRLYAFVLPADVRIDDIAAKGMDMHDLENAPALFRDLADRAVKGVEVISSSGRADRGAAVFEYEIIR